MQKSKLFAVLPDYVCTPDGMEIDWEGRLIVSCPNFADDSLSGCVIRIDPQDMEITKWFDVPVHPETGIARNMGIAFDADYNIYLCDNQGWSGREGLAFKGRILKIKADENGILEWHTVATGMEHPNGIRIRNGYMYVTQSRLSRVSHPSGHLVSCVYRFGLDERNVQVTNTLDDPHIFSTFVTDNEECQYGADGIVFGADGNLYVGNFGDGAVHKLTFAEDGTCASNTVFARDYEQLKSTDGMICGEDGTIYIADFNQNAIVAVDREGTVKKLAQSPDCDGLDGGLDQPGEPIIWNGKLVISCFDLVADETKVNTGHEMPATMAYLDLDPNQKKREPMSRRQLAQMIDHTLLRADATEEEIRCLCREARENGFACAMVNPAAVRLCRTCLEGSGVRAASVVSFPLGQTTIKEKVLEAQQAIRDGAQEIDYVINVGQLKQGNLAYIEEEMRNMTEVCHREGVVCKVILETCYLTKREICIASQIASRVKPDFIKTSTGFGTAGASAEDVRLMKAAAGKNVKVKASGGIRGWESCREMMEAGAERIGTSSGIHILEEFSRS